MEVISSEVLCKASSAILVCFLVARFVSFLLSFSTLPPNDQTRSKASSYKRTATGDHDHLGGHKKQLKTIPVSSSNTKKNKKKKRVRFLDQEDAQVVDFVKKLEVKDDFPTEKFVGFEGCDGISDGIKENLVGFGESDGISDGRENLVGVEGVDGICDGKGEGENLVGNEGGEGISDGKEVEKEVGISDGRGEGEEEEGWEWEGIERSELEREFGRARDFVEFGDKEGRFSMFGSDVIMQLYGLQKVAMEGPCYEAQPMALKLSARAKWNAWQRLGNMSPEQAMEKYISLLSDIVPQWMDSQSSVEMDTSSKEDVHSLLDANTNPRLAHHSTSASERTSELRDLTDISTSKNKGKQ